MSVMLSPQVVHLPGFKIDCFVVVVVAAAVPAVVAVVLNFNALLDISNWCQK